MGKLIVICVALFVLAAGYIVLAQGQEAAALSNALSAKPLFDEAHGRDLAALYDAFRAEPLLDEVAWLVVVLMPFVLLPLSLWFRASLVRQREAAKMLRLRFDDARQGARQLAKSHIDTETAVHHLARTDPQAAISAIQQRLAEAERVAQVQSNRNEMPDLQSRVDYIRDQQEALKKQLAPVLDKRRSIENLFMDLDNRQNDIDRALAEIVSADDSVALDMNLNNFMEFIKRSHGRCDDIERASKMAAGLKQDCTELETRLAPFAAAEGGVQSRIKDLTRAREQLATLLASLEQTQDGPLSEQVQKFAEDHKTLEGRISELELQFSQLLTLREGVAGLFEHINRALDLVGDTGEPAKNIDARVDELRTFIGDTRSRFDDIERRMAVFDQLRARLEELKSKLAPLESEHGGVVSVIGELKELCDGLASTIKRLEESDDGNLAQRVKSFADTKRELEERVAMLSEQCFKLATTRKDITGLLQKLSTAVVASERWSKDSDGLNGKTEQPGSSIHPD